MDTRRRGGDHAAVSDDSQIQVPASFVALFVGPGRVRPHLPRATIVERHEFCEDLAQALAESARQRARELGVPEDDLLERIDRGLAQGDTGVDEAEAPWVSGRVRELLAG